MVGPETLVDDPGSANPQDRVVDQTYAVLTDERGTVMGVLNATPGSAPFLEECLFYNSTGLAKNFDAQGNPVYVAGSTSVNVGKSLIVPFGWTGLYRDRFTGKYHAHYRDYDPLHERWTTEDPAGYADGLNLYHAYMGVEGTDPLGLDTPEIREGFKGRPELWVKLQTSYAFGLVNWSYGDDIYLGEVVADPRGEEALIKLGSGRYATMESVKEVAGATFGSKWDSFDEDHGFSLNLGVTQKASGLRGAMIGRVNQAQSLGIDNPFYANRGDVVAHTGKSADLVYEAAFWYATAGMTFADSIKVANTVSKSGIAVKRKPIFRAGSGGNDYITFYHGTNKTDAESIRKGGISLEKSNPGADFGLGFYLSQSEDVAKNSASRLYGVNNVEVLAFKVHVDDLNSLSALKFADAGSAWSDFTRFHKLRSPETLLHGGKPYDIVSGPMVRRVRSNGEVLTRPGHQTSIHTQEAINLFYQGIQ